MKLIGSLSSPYLRTVRVVLAENNLDYRFLSADVWAQAPTIGDYTPLGRVPCLILEAG